ncbi:glucosamine-6-phosphate deaminase [Niallia endozanthoxylica]|uniref:Glucosamine-6-phosphate deaminase n=1 Tax=Niallia endozanthoxylica TaxID=2036016 RepID=A0A5J5HJQ7_9BACI|nr:glucosamine-6-phosphate deaminase [Niallia endozanthoxylica]KAA9021040.1 glucosamine-6-phosphate deaminase [Niallia endozanthoxylica]
MNLIEVKDYEEMSAKAAEYLVNKVRNSPKITLGMATGGTPEGTYRQLIEDHRENHTSYQHVTTFNLDEYVGLSGDHPNSYRYFMNKKLFDHIDIQKSNTYVPRGDARDIQKECLDYEKLLEEKGGIDLQLLGIGSNGHIGFNEPGASFDSKTHLVTLTPSTREANARYFSSLEEVPTQAISMGISTIMKAKEILLLVSGEKKSKALAQLLNGEITENNPASVLKNHPNVTIIADYKALAAK